MNIGKFGELNENAIARRGIMEISGTTTMLDGRPIEYYSIPDGSHNGMIYYTIGDREPDRVEVPVIESEKQEQILFNQNSIRVSSSGIRRVGDALVGTVEVLGAALCITGDAALVLDDGTIIGFADDAAIPIVSLAASGLLVDAGRRFKNAFGIDDCQLSNW